MLFIEHSADFGQVEEWIALKYGLFIVIELVVTARSLIWKYLKLNFFSLHLSGGNTWGFFLEHSFQVLFLWFDPHESMCTVSKISVYITNNIFK